MPLPRAIFVLLTVALLVGSAEVVFADTEYSVTYSATAAANLPSWPQFRGPKNDNLSTETGLLKQWPEGGPKLLWTAKGLGGGFSSVTLSGGRIYTCGNVDGHTAVTAIDLEGKTLWQVPIGEAWEGAHAGRGRRPLLTATACSSKHP